MKALEDGEDWRTIADSALKDDTELWIQLTHERDNLDESDGDDESVDGGSDDEDSGTEAATAEYGHKVGDRLRKRR